MNPVFLVPQNSSPESEKPSARISTAMQFISMLHKKQSPKVIPKGIEGAAELIEGSELSVYEIDTMVAALRTLEDYFTGKLKISTYEKPVEEKNPFDNYVLKSADCPYCSPRPTRNCPYCKGTGSFTIIESRNLRDD